MSAFGGRRATMAIGIDIIPPERAAAPAFPFTRAGEVVDARFVTIAATAGRKQAEPAAAKRAAPPSRPVLAGLEAALGRFSARDFALAVVVASSAVFALALGLAGDGAPPAPVSALDITHATVTPQDANGMRILLINGIVANRSNARAELPALNAELVAGGEVVARAVIAPPAAVIEPGQSRGFSTRLPHPGGKLPQLQLSFAGALPTP